MSAPSDDDVRRMALHLCGAADLCGCSGGSETICASSIKRATEAIRLGAKLPDLRMERGRVAYEAYLGDLGYLPSEVGWAECSDQFKEAWARVAEAARAAP